MSDPQQQTLPENPEALSRLYNQTVESHQSYLEKLHKAFDDRCEAIRLEAHQKLDAIPESDTEARQAVIDEEKKELDKTLAELKYAINQSSRESRKALEGIEEKIDTSAFNLERELAQLNH